VNGEENLQRCAVRLASRSGFAMNKESSRIRNVMRLPRLINIQSAALAMALASTGIGAESVAVDELIQKGNVFYDKLQPAEALKYYLPAEKLAPDNAELLVRIARQYRHLMSDTRSLEEKVRLGTVAVKYADRAVALAPDDPEAQLAVAISYAKLLPFQSNKEQFFNSRVIKTAADKVIALDPSNDLGWHVLGRWKFNIAAIGGLKRVLAQTAYGKLPTATYEEAVRCYEKAIELNPKRLMHYIELGRTYAVMGKTAEARTFITKGLAMPDTEKDDPETKRQGRDILQQLR
jgi:tetratricopeptide (TPR) repeat protein